MVSELGKMFKSLRMKVLEQQNLDWLKAVIMLSYWLIVVQATRLQHELIASYLLTPQVILIHFIGQIVYLLSRRI